jgi:hypothetical protein
LRDTPGTQNYHSCACREHYTDITRQMNVSSWNFQVCYHSTRVGPGHNHPINIIFRRNAPLCVSARPTAIVQVGRRRRRRDKMFSAKYLANDTKFSDIFLTGFFWLMSRRIKGSLVGVASRV